MLLQRDHPHPTIVFVQLAGESVPIDVSAHRDGGGGVLEGGDLLIDGMLEVRVVLDLNAGHADQRRLAGTAMMPALLTKMCSGPRLRSPARGPGTNVSSIYRTPAHS
jgi:hypothetical protein